ncbi:hypothetical protein GZH47_00250 [Paenibacillus rhizovicinus]|uniref:Uncharacterized protein n=1 Tax=Paenibacillus rhizovicinus TaxID=2704463 RepID=A0A6C0NTH4_9BACL|nr:hypothetical protein [Paenibacillus rhizovicinus]QHW29411.1 hypothetical protein GZH47_00250 [Paenibacillus rhizovicinus]
MGLRRPEECTSSHNTDGGAIHSLVQYTHLTGMSLIETMGYTGDAFRLIIDRESVEVGSYSFFDWKLRHSKALECLGFTTRTTGNQTNIAPTPEELEEGLQFVQESIDRGIPALGWDLFMPEWGVIYGYDDEKRVLQCRDMGGDGELPYEKLGRGEVTELYVLAIAGSRPLRKTDMLANGLRVGIAHALEPYAELDRGSHRNGLAAYDAWIEAFTNRSADPFGNSVMTMKAADAREFAALFLELIANQWEESAPHDAHLREKAFEAAVHYRNLAERLAELRDMFPFPSGGSPNEEGTANYTIRLLQEAKSAEAAGVGSLQQMLECLETKVSQP